jgi:hypothetical protein
VLDSTPVYNAMAAQATLTQLRAAIRKRLAAVGALEGQPLPVPTAERGACLVSSEVVRGNPPSTAA